MFFALLSMPIVIIATVDIDFSAFNTVYYNATDGTEYRFVANLFAASWQDIVSGMAWGLGYFGMPHIIVRFMSIEKPSMVKKSAIVASVWVVITLLAAIVIAILGRAIVGQELLESGMQKTVFIVLARRYFPSFIAGILLSAIIAASMSTADSQLLVATSAFTNDLYRPLIHKKASDKEMLLVGKLVVVAVALVGFFIARSNGSGAQAIMNMVEHAWGLFGAAFGPVVLLSLFWKRFTYAGALTGVVVGALTDIVWLLTLSASTGVYELLPGFFAGSLASVIASLIDKKPSVEVIAIYNRATDDNIDD